MACATLKRSCEWDPLQSPGGRTPKRRRCSPMMSPSPKIFKSAVEKPSPFGNVGSKLTSEQIAVNLREEIKKLQRRRQLRFDGTDGSTENPTVSSPQSASTSYGFGLMSPALRDKPIFSFTQVKLLCETMLNERETKIRDEYDRVLNTKLAEQYDTFVKFTYDQIQKRYENSIPSYLS